MIVDIQIYQNKQRKFYKYIKLVYIQIINNKLVIMVDYKLIIIT